MQGANLHITKGAILAYRLYDVAHEIDLKKAESLLMENTPSPQNVRRYQLKTYPLGITFRQAPLIVSGADEEIEIKLSESESKKFNSRLEVKLWDYGVVSLCYRIKLPENFLWKDLVSLGAILDTDSIIDELSKKKRDEIIDQVKGSLKNPFTHSIFEDYTTYLIEGLEDVSKSSTDGEAPKINLFKDPLDAMKKASVAELLLAEPTRILSDSTKKSVLSNISQYSKKDLLIMDWNSAVVFDFTKEKEYQDYVDIIEFSQAQLLELRIYDQLLDEKLDELYDSMENKDYMKITDFYSKLSQEAGSLFMEFSDVFEKLDNSIKTVGDFYLAKILKSADRRFGFEDLKKSMSRKIEALANLSGMFQDKIDSLVDERRNTVQEHHTKVTHRMELIVIILIAIEVIPTLYKHYPDIMNFIHSIF